MDKIFAIYKKEVKGFFFSPTFYVVAFFCSAVMSWLYPIQLSDFLSNLKNQMFQQGMPPQALNAHYALFIRHLVNCNLLLIFIVPALTMKLFAEERKLRTFDLLLTSPITSVQIVVGKYLSVLTAIFAIMLIALSYPAMTAFFAKIEWVPLMIAALGIFLVGAVYAAMNLFCSALTESAVIAYVMAVILNVSVWFVGAGLEVVDSPWGRQIFEHISLNSHLVGMVEGTIRTSGLIFFLSVVFLFCFLCERVVESLRWR